MDCSMPGLLVHQQLPEFTHHSFQRNPRADLLQNGLVLSPCSPRDSQESSPHHSSKASILQRSAFLTVQLSHPYMTTGKTIASLLSIKISTQCRKKKNKQTQILYLCNCKCIGYSRKCKTVFCYKQTNLKLKGLITNITKQGTQNLIPVFSRNNNIHSCD